MNRPGSAYEEQMWFRPVIGAIALTGAVLLTACSTLFAPSPPAPRFYTLDASAAIGTPSGAIATSSPGVPAPVMIVAPPHAEAGFDTDRIVYVLEQHRLQPYADSQWIDTPSKMLAPLLAAALSRTGAFGAVVPAPSPVNSPWELQSDVLRLQQEVVAGTFRFTLRVTLIEKKTRTVVFSREFDASAPIAGTGPAAAVVAANVVVGDVLGQVAAACAIEVSRQR